VVLAGRLLAAVPDGQTCSAGVAEWDGSEAMEGTIARADHALYDAKMRGRNRAVIAHAERPIAEATLVGIH
jgi:PleD family two-component response regulator